jgi:hypothetical protein
MQVLLAGFDLFKEVGGGQTFYRNVVLRNPDIQFTYLQKSESFKTPRPSNANAVPWRAAIKSLRDSSGLELEVPPSLYHSFTQATSVARAVAGQRFDVVDVPDYEQFGLFLRDALAYHDVSVDRIALGMHGRISTSLELNWCALSRDCSDVIRLENMQYKTVDVRYFYSEMYRNEWRAVDPVPAPVLDPLWFFDVPRLLPYQDRLGAPDLNFVGRCEKRKGPDIFVNLAWWLPPDCVGSIKLIGPQNYDRDGSSSDGHVAQMLRNRRLSSVEQGRCMTPAELAQVYAGKSNTFVPSVYDTLNFVALESLLAGCPTAIGSGCGVCGYLRKRFPELPFEEIDVANWCDSLPRIEAILRDYDNYRGILRNAILKQDLQPRGLRLPDVYRSPPAYDSVLRVRVSQWYDRLRNSVPRIISELDRDARVA